MKGLITASLMALTVIFTSMAADKYTVTVKSENLNRGYVYIGDNKASLDTTITPGESITLHAIPRNGYSFAHWYDFSGTLLLGGATTTVTPRANQTYTAVFIPRKDAVSSIAQFINSKPGAEIEISSPMTVVGVIDDYAYMTDGTDFITVTHDVSGIIATSLQRGDILSGMRGIHESVAGEHRMIVTTLPEQKDGNSLDAVPAPARADITKLPAMLNRYVTVEPVTVSATEQAEFLTVTDIDGHTFPLYSGGMSFDPDAYHTITGIISSRMSRTCLVPTETAPYSLGNRRFMIRATADNPEMGLAYIMIRGITEMEIGDGDETTIIAEPYPGVRFLEWKRNGAFLSDEPTVVDRPMTTSEYRAYFSYILERERTVSVASSDPGKGTVEIEGFDGSSVTSRLFLTLRAKPLTRYDHFVDWTDADGNVISTEPQFTYREAAPIALQANFITLYDVTTRADGNGWIALELPDGNLVPATALIEQGTPLKLMLHPGAESSLLSLTVNAEDFTAEYTDSLRAEKPFTITVNEPLHIEARFSGTSYVVEFGNPANGRIAIYTRLNGTSGAGPAVTSGTNFPQPTPLYVFLHPDSGYQLRQLTVNDQPVSEFTSLGTTMMAFVMLDSRITLSASFDLLSAIDAPSADDSNTTTVRHFDLRGIELTGRRLAPGLYVERRGSQSRIIRITTPRQ